MTIETQIINFNRTYTNEEFEALPVSGRLLQLIDGKLVEKMPGDRHGRIANRIAKRYHRFDLDDKLGQMWLATTFDMGLGWMPIPDVGFMMADRVPIESDGSIKGLPDLVVEVHSPSDLDTTPGRDAARNKIRKYQEFGVRIIWAINPRQQTVEIYHLDRETPVVILSVNDELDGENVIPGFRMPVKALFEK